MCMSSINCSIWLDASHISWDGGWLNRSDREVKCKSALSNPEDWIRRYIRSYLYVLLLRRPGWHPLHAEFVLLYIPVWEDIRSSVWSSLPWTEGRHLWYVDDIHMSAVSLFHDGQLFGPFNFADTCFKGRLATNIMNKYIGHDFFNLSFDKFCCMYIV